MPPSDTEMLARLLAVTESKVENLEKNDDQQWVVITEIKKDISDLRISLAKTSVYVGIIQAVLTAVMVWFFTRDADARPPKQVGQILKPYPLQGVR